MELFGVVLEAVSLGVVKRRTKKKKGVKEISLNDS